MVRKTVVLNNENTHNIQCYQAELIKNKKPDDKVFYSFSKVLNMVLEKGFPRHRKKVWEKERR